MRVNRNEKNLLFCMTPGVGFNNWKEIGIMERELKPYLSYLERGWKIKAITFDSRPPDFIPKGIEPVCINRGLLGFLPYSHAFLGKWADVIKTNQSNNAHYYTFAARAWRKPILVRCGYVAGESKEFLYGRSLRVQFYHLLERYAFSKAAICEVPTDYLSTWVKDRYKVNEKKIEIMPNFIDIDLFKPNKTVFKPPKSIIAVGRLHKVKRYDLLLKACRNIDGCVVTIIGRGDERHSLVKLASDTGVKFKIIENINNQKLPTLLNGNEVFVQTSSWEGNPKALLEAMSCGMKCVVVRIPQVDLINNGKNGWLSSDDPGDLARVIEIALSYKGEDVGDNARRYVENNHEFGALLEREECILRKLVETARLGETEVAAG